jgi:hypothetical protein
LEEVYPDVLEFVKTKHPGEPVFRHIDLKDAFALRYGILAKKTVEDHIGRMLRIGMIELVNGGMTETSITYRIKGGEKE